MSVRILDCGDAAFTIEFGDAIDPALLDAVQGLDRAIEALRVEGGVQGLIETMPTFRSLTVFFDPLRTGRRELLAELQPLLEADRGASQTGGCRWTLPVCYEGEAGPDLQSTAQALGLSTDELIALHSGLEYRVYMLGFLPGFAFMGELPATLRLPRRSEPRTAVPAGSVAIAASLTAVYPWQSPGGWHLLGRCPLPLFDLSQPSPTLLAAGDHVRFAPVSIAECRRLAAAVEAGDLNPRECCARPDSDRGHQQ